MLEKLFPDIYIKSIAEMPIEELKKRGIKALVFDIDNTISPYDVAEPDDDALAVLDKLKDEGFKICLLSNNKEQRIKLFNKKIGAYAYWELKSFVRQWMKWEQTAKAQQWSVTRYSPICGADITQVCFQ